MPTATLSAALPVTVKAPLVNRWLAVGLTMLTVGLVASGTLTVMEKVRVMMLLLAPPSLTVTEIVAKPEVLAAGAKTSEPAGLGLV